MKVRDVPNWFQELKKWYQSGSKRTRSLMNPWWVEDQCNKVLNGSGERLSSTSRIYFARHWKAILGA